MCFLTLQIKHEISHLQTVKKKTQIRKLIFIVQSLFVKERRGQLNCASIYIFKKALLNGGQQQVLCMTPITKDVRLCVFNMLQ